MRKFKVFVASILSYLMLISLVPSGLVETVVKASENDYVKFVKEGYYLRSNAQYNNQTLVTYIENNGSSNELYVALVQNGKETVLKKENNCDVAFIVSNNSSKVVIQYCCKDGVKYEEFNFETLKFNSITETEYNTYVKNINLYPTGYSKSLVQSFSSDRDEVIEEALSKINQYNEGYNLTISDKVFIHDLSGLVYGNDNGETLEVYAYKINVYNDDLNLSNNAITLDIKINDNAETKNYRAVVSDSNAYIEEVEEEYADSFYMGHYDGYYSLFLTRDLGDETQRLVEITNGDIVTNQVVDFGYKAFNKIGNNIYIQEYYPNKTLKVYSKQGNEYKLSKEIDCLASNLGYSKSPNYLL